MSRVPVDMVELSGFGAVLFSRAGTVFPFGLVAMCAGVGRPVCCRVPPHSAPHTRARTLSMLRVASLVRHAAYPAPTYKGRARKPMT